MFVVRHLGFMGTFFFFPQGTLFFGWEHTFPLGNTLFLSGTRIFSWEHRHFVPVYPSLHPNDRLSRSEEKMHNNAKDMLCMDNMLGSSSD